MLHVLNRVERLYVSPAYKIYYLTYYLLTEVTQAAILSEAKNLKDAILCYFGIFHFVQYDKKKTLRNFSY